jgi:tRNA wybutosine-synthesizing protein 3
MQNLPDTGPHERTYNPHHCLANAVAAVLSETDADLGIDLLDDLPKKWQRLGNLVLLPKTAFSSEKWRKITLDEGFWLVVATALNAMRLGRQADVDAGVMRHSHAELLLGDDGWVEHREHGVTYCFDATKVMFSAGNISERGWTGTIAAQGEVVVDLFCGIGYYSLPLLVNAGVAHVHACEMNPDSITALRTGLELNGVAEQCTIHEGDNQETAPALAGIADRVLLGLLPSSEASWPLAVRCLKPDGGVLHVHMNVVDKNPGDIGAWGDKTLSTFNTLAQMENRQWELEIIEIRKVKWYAPHIRHCVLILKAQPKEYSGNENNS